MIYLTIIVFTMFFLLTLYYIFTLRNSQKEMIQNLKSQQNKFISEIESIFQEQELAKKLEIMQLKEKHENLKLKHKNSKVNRVIESIIRELKEEGISVITTESRKQHNDYFHLYDAMRKIEGLRAPRYENHKYIVVSYDNMKEMHELLFSSSDKFKERYKIKYRYDVLQRYLRIHYKDKEIVKEMLKDKIKKDLGKELTSILISDNSQNEALSITTNTKKNNHIFPVSLDTYRKEDKI